MLRVIWTIGTLMYKTFDGKQGGVACGYTRIKNWLAGMKYYIVQRKLRIVVRRLSPEGYECK